MTVRLKDLLEFMNFQRKAQKFMNYLFSFNYFEARLTLSFGFPSRRLSVTFDIQIDLKKEHP